MAAHKPNLNVMTWNADSISPKKHEFFDYLLSNDIDIALINETFLKQGTPFFHPDFRCYRLDREGARTKRGVAIHKTKVLECIGISVSSPTGEIHFISTYRPGGRSYAENIRNFKSDVLTHKLFHLWRFKCSTFFLGLC
jgi:exonuclease III